MSRQTLEQKRAEHAWHCAEEGCALSEEYKRDAKGLPALILNSGLMQVMAFLHDKKDRHELLIQHLLDWLHEQCHTPKDFTPFMEYLLQAEPAEFRAITAEALAWLKWLRQMTSARC
jgi:CRISPR-associated protein Cmr5